MGKKNKLIQLRVLLLRFKVKCLYFFSMSWKLVNYSCLGIYKKVRCFFSERQRSLCRTLFENCREMTLRPDIEYESLIMAELNDKFK